MKIGTSWGNQLSENRVIADMAEAITEKGWKKVDSEATANVVVVIHGATQVKQTLNTFYSGMGGYGYGITAWAAWAWPPAPRPSASIPVGTLVVDIFDTKTKNLVYPGHRERRDQQGPEEEREEARQGCAETLQGLPAEGQEVTARHSDRDRCGNSRRNGPGLSWTSG